MTMQASVVRTIRPDTVFIPYHWAGARSANQLTHRSIDPRSKIPEFKVSACNVRKAAGPPPDPGRVSPPAPRRES
jgi:assimilatory nitrate reductase catalytic subunit